MKSTIIYLPGFNSSPQSEKSAQLKQHFPGLIVASYNTWHPDLSYRQLEALIAPQVQDNLVLIGSSLGGFWAYQFAKRYALKCVLLNPCMTPELTLKPFAGEVENMYSKERGYMPPEELLKYESYRVPGTARCTVLHEKGDELIPYQESVQNFQDNAKLVLLEGGSHRFNNIEAAVREIREMLNLGRSSEAPA